VGRRDDGPAGACATVCQRFLRLLYDYSQTSADLKCLDMVTIGIGRRYGSEIPTFQLPLPFPLAKMPRHSTSKRV
jgi:hypothetical protein